MDTLQLWGEYTCKLNCKISPDSLSKGNVWITRQSEYLNALSNKRTESFFSSTSLCEPIVSRDVEISSQERAVNYSKGDLHIEWMRMLRHHGRGWLTAETCADTRTRRISLRLIAIFPMKGYFFFFFACAMVFHCLMCLCEGNLSNLVKL